jgi:iron-regulated transporter 1
VLTNTVNFDEMASKQDERSVVAPDHIELAVAGRVAIEMQRNDQAPRTSMDIQSPTKQPEAELAKDQELPASGKPKVTKVGLVCLLAQQASSTWSTRSAEFSFYLFLIILFPDTLLLASIYGFCTTAVSILFSAWVGGLIDKTPRLKAVRVFLAAQKLS